VEDASCVIDGYTYNQCKGGSCGTVKVTCGAYRCDQATQKSCLTSCKDGAGNCFTDYYCEQPKCLPQKGKGGSCANGGQCLSGDCKSGVCQ
jgi:hypothetical protein